MGARRAARTIGYLNGRALPVVLRTLVSGTRSAEDGRTGRGEMCFRVCVRVRV